MKLLFFASSACLLAAFPVRSQSPPNGSFTGNPPIEYETAHLSKIVTAVRATERIILDGRLEEPAWRLALPATDFKRFTDVLDAPPADNPDLRRLLKSRAPWDR